MLALRLFFVNLDAPALASDNRNHTDKICPPPPLFSSSFTPFLVVLQALEGALSQRGRPPVALEPQPQQARGVDGLGWDTISRYPMWCGRWMRACTGRYAPR